MDIQENGWVAEANTNYGLCFRPQLARVKRVHPDGSLDLVFYSCSGLKLGRVSPAMGGPKGYEPCCDAENWEPIGKPDFTALQIRRYAYGYLLDWKRPHPEFVEDAQQMRESLKIEVF